MDGIPTDCGLKQNVIVCSWLDLIQLGIDHPVFAAPQSAVLVAFNQSDASACTAYVCQFVAQTITTAAVIGRRVAMQPASQLCAHKSAPGETEQLDCCLLLHHHRLFVPGEGNSGVTRVYVQILLFFFTYHLSTIPVVN